MTFPHHPMCDHEQCVGVRTQDRPADVCHAHGWAVGDSLRSACGTLIRITAIGLVKVLAVEMERNGSWLTADYIERDYELVGRCWRREGPRLRPDPEDEERTRMARKALRQFAKIASFAARPDELDPRPLTERARPEDAGVVRKLIDKLRRH